MIKKGEKITKSIACPYCKSSNINTEINYLKDHDEVSSYDDESIVGVYSKSYICHCNNCNKDYTVDYGYDKYVIFNNPVNQATWTVDNELIAKYESDSDRNYEIIKGREVDGKHIYFIIYEDDPYPIFINESDINKYVCNVGETKKLIFGTWMNRYR